MQLDPSYSPQVNTTDASGMPKLPRSQLAYARTAPAFTRALASVNQSGSLAPEGGTAAWALRFDRVRHCLASCASKWLRVA